MQDLLAAAAQVFEEYGYADGTTNRIAGRAGVSIGTLYQYFPSKDAIAVALYEQHANEAMTRLNQWVTESVTRSLELRAMLRLFVDGMIRLHAERPRLLHILLEQTRLPHKIHDQILSVEREAAKIVEGLLGHCSSVRHPRLGQAAVFVVQMTECLAHHVVSHPEQGLDLHAFRDEMVIALESYLKSDDE